ncbi:MAG: putative metal-binding motif-containing protein [Myxococcota bacterium]|nr:putative metal-binding motif-containing protein [Myxococcota bacterium]
MQCINQRYFFLSMLIMSSACVDGKFNVDQFLTPAEQLDQDGDGFTIEQGDCNDQDISIYPNAQEICDGVDNNCNLEIDEESLIWEWTDSSVRWSAGVGVEMVEVTIDDEGWDDDDYMADGILDERQRYHFDSDGSLLRKEVDRGGDGIADISVSYSYNSLNLLATEDWDRGLDGRIDRRVSYTYNANGQLLRVERDDDADGIIEFRESFAYSAAGLIEHSIDEDGDGVLEEREIRVYSDSRLSEVSRYVGGSLDSWEVYQYASDGTLLYKEVDSNDDGDDILDSRFTYSPGESDGMRLIEVDHCLDGMVDDFYFEYYDSEGLLIKQGKDFDADEDADQILNLRYSVRGLEEMHSINTHTEDEELVSIETIEPKRFLQTTVIDTHFFEAYIEKDVSFTCLPLEPTEEASEKEEG